MLGSLRCGAPATEVHWLGLLSNLHELRRSGSAVRHTGPQRHVKGKDYAHLLRRTRPVDKVTPPRVAWGPWRNVVQQQSCAACAWTQAGVHLVVLAAACCDVRVITWKHVHHSSHRTCMHCTARQSGSTRVSLMHLPLCCLCITRPAAPTVYCGAALRASAAGPCLVRGTAGQCNTCLTS